MKTSTIIKGTSLIARLMGAVRNSNTRASHASVEMAQGPAGESRGAASAGGGPGSAGGPGSSLADSAHLSSEGPDRRSSFSYFRRASERRRRLRMKEQMREEAELGSMSNAGGPQREGQLGMDVGAKGSIEAGQQQRAAIQRSQAVQDERGNLLEEEAAMLDEGGAPGEDLGTPTGQYLGRSRGAQFGGGGGGGGGSESSGQNRRQSINDRLTEAVSDVIEFVREESFKRGKRHSFHRRRQTGGYGTGSAHSGSGLASGTGGDELDSEAGRPGIGYGRKRRLMRRSPRRNQQQQQQQQPAARAPLYNDSDTGSMASVGQPRELGGGQFGPLAHGPHQQGYKLRQQAGSVQEGGAPMYAAYGPGAAGRPAGRSRMQLMEQHRRHQSADACDQTEATPMLYQTQRGHRTHASSHHLGGASDGYASDVLLGHRHQRPDQDELASNLTSGTGATSSTSTGATMRPPIQVGASPPPPPIGSADAELAAARRKREEDLGALADDDDGETAIHVGPDEQVGGPVGGGGRKSSSQSPVRFIAPKVAPLQSPSALLMPDEEVVPPDVPYRGRRLPQIPGSAMIKSAADFLASSLYGAGHHGATPPDSSVGATVAGAASAPLVVAGVPSAAGPVFPSVSESPTIKIDGPIPPLAGQIVKKQSSFEQPEPSILEAGQAAGSGRPGLQLAGGAAGGGGSGAGASVGINFPRVSFSPTHTSAPATGAQSLEAALASGDRTASAVAVAAGGASGLEFQHRHHHHHRHQAAMGPGQPHGAADEQQARVAAAWRSGRSTSAGVAPASGGQRQPAGLKQQENLLPDQRDDEDEDDDWF